MRQKIASIITLLLVIFAPLGLCSTAFSEEHSTGCSLATLKGTYGFYKTGTTLWGPLSAVGILNFDGKGDVSVKEHISTIGKGPGAGPSLYYLKESYKVEIAANCTTKTFHDGTMNSWGTIVDNGNRIVLMSRLAGYTVYGEAVKIHTNTLDLSSSAFSETGCSAATLIGDYGFRRSGFNLDGPMVGVGTLTYDGRGNSTSRQLVSRDGKMEVVTGEGQLEVASDCTTEGLLTWGVIVDNGNRVFFMSRVEGVMISGISEKIHQK